MTRVGRRTIGRPRTDQEVNSIHFETAPSKTSRVAVDGKFFTRGGRRFPVRGVTYGTFAPRDDGAQFPPPQQVKQDLITMRDAGFTSVRTYTDPPEDVLDVAADCGLTVLSGVTYPDWRHTLGASRRERRRVVREAREAVRAEARRLRGRPEILGLVLGNEIPADVVRWLGGGVVEEFIAELAEVAHEEDPDLLVTYGNYPTTEWLSLESLDFLTFNVFLEDRSDFRRYLTRLHHLAGDRPLVLGETGIATQGDPVSEARQADALDWQLAFALDRGVAGSFVFSWTDEWWVDGPVDDWRFGITREDRSPRPALEVARSWNARGVRDLKDDWPALSVVICAYNAASTLDECLRHTCALDYPDLEIIVVDDGSTDETASIVRRYRRARLVPIEHAGLSVARNEGFRAATGTLVAYLDADAFPSPEWPYYLVLGLDSKALGGVGGPNVPPRDDPLGAQAVARAPGGPVHVLLSDDRAEHVPGCNMAFYRHVLEGVAGFDPVYIAAGDDVDLCWRVLDHGREIAFHPAALVWHRRRPGMRTYLRQQKGYGRAEALVEARHPDRFTAVGTARWRGRIYDSFAPSLRRQRIYRGVYGAAAYQSVYWGGGHTVDLVHQVGVPWAFVGLATAPASLLHPLLALPALMALMTLVALIGWNAVRVSPPRSESRGPRFRLLVGLLNVTQPVMRTWGRIRHAMAARRDAAPTPLPSAEGAGRGVLLFGADRPRPEMTAAIISNLRRDGYRVFAPSGWEDHDAAFTASSLLLAKLVTSAHPKGCVQVRVLREVRARSAAVYLVLTAVAFTAAPPIGVAVSAIAVGELLRGWWRSGPGPLRTIRRRAEPVGSR